MKRHEAISLGLVTYDEGKPCINGHGSLRNAVGNYCPLCKSIGDRRWNAKNKERKAVHSKEWFSKNRGRARELGEAWRVNNREKDQRIKREGAEQNRQRKAAFDLAWRLNNPDRVKITDRVKAENRRARKVGAAGHHTTSELRSLALRQKLKCANCAASIRKSYQADHILPLFLGGSNWITNIQLLCQNCNQRKSCLHPVVFAQREGRLL